MSVVISSYQAKCPWETMSAFRSKKLNAIYELSEETPVRLALACGRFRHAYCLVARKTDHGCCDSISPRALSMNTLFMNMQETDLLCPASFNLRYQLAWCICPAYTSRAGL